MYLISLLFFNLNGEYITLEGDHCEDVSEGRVIVGRCKLTNVRYSNDAVLITPTVKEMKNLLEKLEIVQILKCFGYVMRAIILELIIVQRKIEGRKSRRIFSNSINGPLHLPGLSTIIFLRCAQE